MESSDPELAYDSSKETSYIFAADCTNCYGKCMKCPLPTGGFDWIHNVDRFDEDFIKSIPDEGPVGYFIEADLEYPEELHDAHDSYPLGPEKMKVKSHLLSAHQLSLAEKLNMKVGGEKVCLTLSDKKKYACHYRQMKQMLELGLKLKKVHRVLKFNQSNWLESYIDTNTEMRKRAKEMGNKCEEDVFKLMNNACFGKTCEDTRRYVDIRLIKDEKLAEKKISHYAFKRHKLYGEDLLAIEMRKTEVTLDKPR